VLLFAVLDFPTAYKFKDRYYQARHRPYFSDVIKDAILNVTLSSLLVQRMYSSTMVLYIYVA